MEDSTHTGKVYDGIDRICRMHQKAIGPEYTHFSNEEKRQHFVAHDTYIGEYTLEVDIFKTAGESDYKSICSIFNQLTNGGALQKETFSKALSSGNYPKCLSQIESSYSVIGKGRFAQRLSNHTSASMIPHYVSNAIDAIVSKVR